VIFSDADPTYNKRMTKAVTSLVIRFPFFGYLLFGSSVKVHADSCNTMETDGVGIFCGRKFVIAEDFEIVMFGLLHELLHIYFNHHGRRETRDPKLWNIAADIFVNGQCGELLGTLDSRSQLIRWPVPPRFIQYQSWADGKTVEEIYVILKKEEEAKAGSTSKYLPEKGQDDEVGNGTDMREPPAAPGKVEDGVDTGPQQANKDFQEAFRQDIAHAKALSETSSMHKALPNVVRERMEKVLRPTLPWGSLIRGGLSSDLGWDEATYAPPKMKYYPIILPQTRVVKERILLLGIDVSTSVTDALIRIFITNVQAAAHRATKVIVVTFDAVVREQYTTTQPRHIFDHVKFKSGEHSYTSAIELFEIAAKEKPSAICILTDGHIKLPDKPVKKTTFVIPTGGLKPPWGTTYVMEHPW
jgi:predicted metal-dependent peptidase